MEIKLTRNELVDVAIRAALAFLIFTAISASGFFCAWIGGVQPFTTNAGMIATLILGLAFTLASITFIRP